MTAKESYSVILTTCGNEVEAERIARLLVENRLAACVQITGVTSFYEWDGKVNKDGEQLLLIKAKTSLYEEIEKAITEIHVYEVPEIIRLPVEAGLEHYLQWIDDVSKK
jgi:periplasmic divalent cation tolerance protein